LFNEFLFLSISVASMMARYFALLGFAEAARPNFTLWFGNK
jgi:hypothetical protein